MKLTGDYPAIILKSGRDKSVRGGHPWIFSGGVAEMIGGPLENGATVTICDSLHSIIGLGAYSNHSQIAVRIWSWNPAEVIDRQFFINRVKRAVNRRISLESTNTTNAYRLIHAESDGLPGVIVDRIADVLVVQLLTAGAEYHREWIFQALKTEFPHLLMYERSDAEVRELEGLAPRVGWVSRSPREETVIQENSILYSVDIEHGQKTGFYSDQRDNRFLLRRYAIGKRVLDVFCYTGGFSLNCAYANCGEITAVDSSADALNGFRKNLALNGYPAERANLMEANAFEQLRRFRDQGQKFDLIILDPPKLAPTSAFVNRAARAYKDINLLALKLLTSDGILATFSCSGGMPLDLFRKIVLGAAQDAGVSARAFHVLHQAEDHPVLLNFPEGEYLKGLLCSVENKR